MERLAQRRQDRRWFEHLFAELSVELGQLAPRYALWQRLGELAGDPATLSPGDVDTFCQEHLVAFLADHDLVLNGPSRRRLLRTMARFDPQIVTPAEHMARICSPPDGPGPRTQTRRG